MQGFLENLQLCGGHLLVVAYACSFIHRGRCDEKDVLRAQALYMLHKRPQVAHILFLRHMLAGAAGHMP